MPPTSAVRVRRRLIEGRIDEFMCKIIH
jgi:hypothetical protein